MGERRSLRRHRRDDRVDEHHQRRGGRRHPCRVLSEVRIDEGDDRDRDEAAAEPEEHGGQADEAAEENQPEELHALRVSESGDEQRLGHGADVADLVSQVAIGDTATIGADMGANVHVQPLGSRFPREGE